MPTPRSERSARVIVHRPDLAHERLSPSNCHELLFDDVIWVRRARQEFDAFVDLMRERGVEVLLFHDLLAETLEDPEAREWLLSRRLRPEEVTAMFSRRADGVDDRDARRRARDAADRRRHGRPSCREDIRGRRSARCRRPTSSCAPLPNQLFTRDTSAWIYGGVVAQPDVLAGAPARDAERRGRLPLPPALPRRRLQDLVRRRRPRLGHGADRGRRHHAGRRRRRARRPRRAQHRAGGEHPGAQPVRAPARRGW